VPSALTEEAETEREEKERQKAKEKKRRAEKARKERRKQEDAERQAADRQLQQAVDAKEMDALCKAIEHAVQAGCPEDKVSAARSTLDKLRRDAADPEVQKRKERERRAAAAEARMAAGGSFVAVRLND